MAPRICLAVLYLLAPLVVTGDEIAVIRLQHRTVDQVVPILQPLVDPGGALSGMDDSLIVRSSPENIEQIRQVLSAIDTAARTLMISVRQGGHDATDRRGAGVDDRIGRGHGDVLQRVKTLEGNPAYIAIGQSVPVPSGYAAVAPGGVVIRNTVTMQDYATGFTVVPRLSGDRVTLEIGAAKDRPIGYGGAGRLQGLATTVGGRLGEWIDLGGVVQSVARDERSITSGATETRSRAATIQVRVDEVR
ncbi:secretin N-terminal domain-containing protein [Methylolobus aquaticus]